ncbi:NUDIX hydrolase [Phytohabitans kaempferiae]|uniref:NUDIX hydrolase n=1 Tax=Phytohabitans kaempferiae TaxID=1620943 RepID=A0ABV6MFS6_9ACTN
MVIDEDGFRLSEALVARMRRFLAGESGPTPVPRVAATVVLLRPADGGFEAYVLRRAASMAFASGVYAFPGGGVDPADAGADLGWAGPPADEWARRLGRPAAEAQAVVCAAVREVFEEAGVLLAEAAPESPLTEPATGVEGTIDTSGDDWERDRERLVRHEVHLAEVLARRGLVLRSDLLGAWARWITPEFETRRFDTYFFVAALPEGQVPRDVSGEADHTMWVRPGDAVARYRAGEIAMLPPTVVLLRNLAEYPDVAAVLAAAADRDAATPVMPRAELAPDGTVRLQRYVR